MVAMETGTLENWADGGCFSPTQSSPLPSGDRQPDSIP